MQNIKNISTSIVTTLTVGELKSIFKNNNYLKLLESGNINFCLDILKKFGMDFENVDLDKISEVNLDFEYSKKAVLQGRKVNIYDDKNKLVSRKFSNSIISSFYGVENFESQIFEELDLNKDNLNGFIKENRYNSEFITSDICALIHMSGYELNLKNYNYYLVLKQQYEESKNEKFIPLLEKAKKENYSYKEMYMTKSIDSKVVVMMHDYTPYIVNADIRTTSFTPEEFEEIVNKATLASAISHSYEYDKLTIEEKNQKDSFMDLVTTELKNYNRFLKEARGYKPKEQIISQSFLSELKDIILLDESYDLEPKIFKLKVIGMEHSLLEKFSSKEKTLKLIE